MPSEAAMKRSKSYLQALADRGLLKFYPWGDVEVLADVFDQAADERYEPLVKAVNLALIGPFDDYADRINLREALKQIGMVK